MSVTSVTVLGASKPPHIVFRFRFLYGFMLVHAQGPGASVYNRSSARTLGIIWKWFITELRGVRPTVFLCTLEVSAMQSAYDDFPASSYAAYRWDAICNDVVRTNGRRLSEQRSHWDCCSPRQRSRIVGRHVTWHNLEYVETRKPAHFIEFASDSGSFFGMDCRSVPCYPPRTERRMEIMSSN